MPTPPCVSQTQRQARTLTQIQRALGALASPYNQERDSHSRPPPALTQPCLGRTPRPAKLAHANAALPDAKPAWANTIATTNAATNAIAMPTTNERDEGDKGEGQWDEGDKGEVDG